MYAIRSYYVEGSSDAAPHQLAEGLGDDLGVLVVVSVGLREGQGPDRVPRVGEGPRLV